MAKSRQSIVYSESIIILLMPKIIKKISHEISYSTGRYLRSPEFLSLIVTFKCNFKCRSCSIWQKETQPEMSVEEWRSLANDFKINFGNNTYVEINGGEALLRKDVVLPLIQDLKKHFASIALNTNGSLIDENTIRELESSGLDLLKLSLYSLEKEVHNNLRGTQQAYDRASQALKKLAASKIKTEVGVLITRENIETLPELIKYLRTLENVSIILQPLDESVESASSKNKSTNVLLENLWPQREQTEKFFNWLQKDLTAIKNSSRNIKAIREYYLQPQSTLHFRCFAGQRNFVIYPNGDTSFCFKGSILGNVRESSLGKILHSKKAMDERRWVANCQKYCRIIGCNFSQGIREYLIVK